MPRLTRASLVLLGLLPVSALAQQQVGSSGRSLDANTRVGSGGLNPVNEPLDFGARNLLITGQVTGGRQFRGDPGFSAAGAFRGELGSDDLFRFRAESASPSALGSRDAGRYAAPGEASGGQSIIFNNFFAPAAGRTGAEPERVAISPDGLGAQRVAPGRAPYNPGLIGAGDGRFGGTEVDSQGDLQRRARGFDETSGRVEDGQGRRLELQASPLFGVTGQGAQDTLAAEQSDARDADAAGLRRTGVDAPGAPSGTGLRDSRFGGVDGVDAPATGAGTGGLSPRSAAGLASPTTEPATAAPAAALPQEAAARLPGTANPGTSPGSRGLPGASRGAASPGVELGSRLNPVLQAAGERGGAAAPAGGESPAGSSRLAELREQIFRPLQEAEDRGDGEAASDPYLELLRRIREGNPGDPAAAPSRPAWMRDLGAVPDEVLDSVESRRRQAVDGVLRGIRGSEAGSSPVPGAAVVDADSQEARAVAGQLGYDGPRLETLRGARETRVNEALAEAEEALAAGRFFDSESLYRQVVRDAGEQPLAQVGLVHAQMAAGMVRSSALTLRVMFSAHPELISARYAERLLPPAERTARIRSDLQKLIDDPESPKAEAALMLAYLGFQIESRQLVRYGLAVAQEAQPADPLLSLLRVAWLGETQAGAAEGEAPPAAQADPGGK